MIVGRNLPERRIFGPTLTSRSAIFENAAVYFDRCHFQCPVRERAGRLQRCEWLLYTVLRLSNANRRESCDVLEPYPLECG